MRNKNLKGQFYLLTAIFLFLAFSGGLFIHAQQMKTMKKPVKPEPIQVQPWQVEFVEPTPTEPPVDQTPGSIQGLGVVPFRTDDFNEVYVEYSEMCKDYHFFLRIRNGSDCFLDFDNITIQDYEVDPLINNPCGFPQPCADYPESCVACFLNNFDHPIEGYDYTVLRFWIPGEKLSGLQPGEFAVIDSLLLHDAYLDINIHNEAPAPNGDSYHSLFTITYLQGLVVTKLENGWAIEFNQSLENLHESYKDTVTYYKGKKEKTAIQYVYPLTVETNPVHFKTIWTQY